MKSMLLLFLVLPLAIPSVDAQDGKKKVPAQGHPKVDPAKVDAAIRKGVAFLKTQKGAFPAGYAGSENQALLTDELVLWTWIKAGRDVVPEDDKDFQALFNLVLEKPLAVTYNVSLLAMILEEVDRVKFQPQIWQCAQFLVDNQSPEGYYAYGAPTVHPKMPAATPTGDRGKVVTAPKGPHAQNTHSRSKPPVKLKIPVKQQRTRPGHDNSNTQYAMLGLRACHDAGIVFEEKVIRLSQKWWRDSQNAPEEGENGKNVATGPGGNYPPAGWNYHGKDAGPACCSMTAGAISGLAICDFILGESWMADKWIGRGVAWMAKHFTVTENYGPPAGGIPAFMHYYYLYGLERAGMIYGTEFFGRNEWYPVGAEFLLKEQKGDGSWIGKPGGGHENAVWDTCFAILFLRRATRPLVDVASKDDRVPVPQEPLKPAEPKE